ncbi:MAG: hypothetical protein K0Q87_1233 [Neobacillus sp.]|jgi:hypothetical protein|nr:hypothetical protein [Neobacillus sp.]
MAKLKINLTVSQATGTENPILVGAEDHMELIEENGRWRQGKRLGSSYTVLMLQSCCTPLVVRVEDEKPIIMQSELDIMNLSGNFCRVSFHDFTAEPYKGKSGLALSATAKKAVIVSPIKPTASEAK